MRRTCIVCCRQITLCDAQLTISNSVNVFYRVNQHRAPVVDGNVERAKQEQEFRIGSIGFADSLGILAASLVAVPMEVFLCNTQIRRGRTLCQGL